MTTVQLFGDIGLYSNYKQIINFTSVSAQNTWFNSKTKKTVTNVIYNKVYNSLKLNMSYGEAIQYSYVRLLDLDNTGRIYYNFVSAVNLIDDATVEFILEPDVIQTYMTYWSLKESMVNRAHVDRWSTSSDNPIRITPNTEGINAIYKIEDKTYYSDLYKGTDVWDGAIQFAFFIHKATSGIVMKFAPVIITDSDDILKPHEGDPSYPTLDAFVNNDLISIYEIDPESIICMGISQFSPFEYVKTSGENNIYYINYDLITTSESFVSYATAGNTIMVNVSLGSITPELTNIFKTTRVTVPFSRPIKPIDNADASDEYEPALYMQPYRSRVIECASSSMSFELPDNVIDAPVDLNGNTVVECTPVFGVSAQQTMISVFPSVGTMSPRERLNEAYSSGLSNIVMMDSIDVFNNAWLTYMLTQRDSDRQIVNNNAISSIIQGLVFGAYGGALVTSRGTGGTDKRALSKMATRMAPGIALGGLASAGAAIIDSHYAWENQMLEERKIQNKAQQISISGTNGAQNALYGLSIPTFTSMKCDDTNYQRAYDNFRKYGYMINQFTELDINSRKYYNYVMTNGAVIGGAIPENVRDIIASIFDSGVTIFHGDYCDTLTYPTKENIERSLMT